MVPFSRRNTINYKLYFDFHPQKIGKGKIPVPLPPDLSTPPGGSQYVDSFHLVLSLDPGECGLGHGQGPTAVRVTTTSRRTHRVVGRSAGDRSRLRVLRFERSVRPYVYVCVGLHLDGTVFSGSTGEPVPYTGRTILPFTDRRTSRSHV